MGRVGTHPRSPPPAPKLQIFKLCRHATVPQSQLLRVVGAQCSHGSHQTFQTLLAAPSPVALTQTWVTITSDMHLAKLGIFTILRDTRDLYKKKDASLASWKHSMVSVGFFTVSSPSKSTLSRRVKSTGFQRDESSYLFLLHFIFLYVYVWVHPHCGMWKKDSEDNS